jgi:hypothetical protein
MIQNRSSVTVLIAAAVLALAPVAHADDDYTDDPGYTTGSQPPGQIGTETWPPVCSDVPLACGLHFHPGPNTWTRPDPEPAH